MKGNLKSATVGAIVNVCLNFLLIPKLKITGAVIATFVSYVVVFIYRVKDTYKYMPIKVVTPFTTKIAVVLLYMLACSFIESPIGYVFLSVGSALILYLTREYYTGLLIKMKDMLLKRN